MDEQQFDVFLCHNTEDKPAVIQIAEQLQQHGLKPWLDKWELRPGFPWQQTLEDQITQIKSAAVFIGQNGIGPWQQQDLRAFLSEFVDRKCPVIPVLLSSASSQPKLPIFLKGMMWVDFRQTEPDPMQQLIWGITGQKPQKRPSEPANPPQPVIATDDLSSERFGATYYAKLRDLLKAQDWKAADQETVDRMCEVMGRQEEGLLELEDVQNFPCQDLQTIDRLWVKYSNGHFGFSVQKKIWQECGSPTSPGKDWDRFCVKVGWQNTAATAYVNYSDLKFDLEKSPPGELPWWWKYASGTDTISSRTKMISFDRSRHKVEEFDWESRSLGFIYEDVWEGSWYSYEFEYLLDVSVSLISRRDL